MSIKKILRLTTVGIHGKVLKGYSPIRGRALEDVYLINIKNKEIADYPFDADMLFDKIEVNARDFHFEKHQKWIDFVKNKLDTPANRYSLQANAAYGMISTGKGQAMSMPKGYTINTKPLTGSIRKAQETLNAAAEQSAKALMDGALHFDIETGSLNPKTSCNHDFVTYTGLRETFEYCSKCDEKKDSIS